jgi:archaemetzincin
MADRQDLLDRLRIGLEDYLQIAVRVRGPWFDPEDSFDNSRGQYNSTRMLRHLLDGAGETTSWILGVASVDLFAPVLTYVFGEAQLEGTVAVVSLHRLRPEAYGLPRDDVLLFRRLLTESVHELGHCFGLIHCLDPACVMHASTYVEDIDLKSDHYCQDCIGALTRVRESLEPRP